MNENSLIGDLQPEQEKSEVESRLAIQLSQPRDNQFFVYLSCINLLILYCRPQNNIPFLGSSKLLIVLSLLPLLVVIPRILTIWRESRVTKLLILLLLLGAAWIPLARNNFWAFQTFRDIAQQFFCFLFPLPLLMVSGTRLRKLFSTFMIAGLYLGAYALTHSGQGPGGFIGDENDFALTLLFLLGISLSLIPELETQSKRFLAIGAAFLCLFGIAWTMSRGGFVGLLGLLVYIFAKSPRKATLFFIGLLMIVGGLFIIPKSYWTEMETITDTQESTAHARIEIWKVAIRIWLNPRHFVFGTGMQNSPYHLGDYEPSINRSDLGKSIAGRAIHSSYVQLAGDLGLAGIFIFFAVVIGTIRQNNFASKQVRLMRQRLRAVISSADEANSTISMNKLSLIHQTLKECDFLQAAFVGVNAGIIGTMGAGAFVSAFYYPPFWTLAILGVCLQKHQRQIATSLQRLL